MHLIMKALYPEGTFSEHCWTIKTLLDVDLLGAMGSDPEVVKLSMVCRRFQEAATMLLKILCAYRCQQKPRASKGPGRKQSGLD